MQLVKLIAAAAEIAGSEYRLAKNLGVSPQVVSDWKHGRRTCTPEDWALLAYAAGLDPEEALIRAVVAKHADTPKGERLLTALGKGLLATGAAASFAISASAVSLWTLIEQYATMYIM
ncbi:MAG: YdaS family helix-turn-helix protein [Oligoflexus sp.]